MLQRWIPKKNNTSEVFLSVSLLGMKYPVVQLVRLFGKTTGIWRFPYISRFNETYSVSLNKTLFGQAMLYIKWYVFYIFMC